MKLLQSLKVYGVMECWSIEVLVSSSQRLNLGESIDFFHYSINPILHHSKVAKSRYHDY